jgi:hypothetical protein
MTVTKLKSTGQTVHELSYMAEGGAPWPPQHTRVLRPFVGSEGSKSACRGEVIIVRRDSLRRVEV